MLYFSQDSIQCTCQDFSQKCQIPNPISPLQRPHIVQSYISAKTSRDGAVIIVAVIAAAAVAVTCLTMTRLLHCDTNDIM